MKETPLFVFSGRVAQGHRLGRRLGFPTANIILSESENAIPHGVYAAWVTLPDGSRHRAVTNIGVRPTVEAAGALWAESYLIGFSGDLYGQTLTVALCVYLREERRFDSLQALRDEVLHNVEQAKELLK